MLTLLSETEVYEELNIGYLNVLNHQKQTLAEWLEGVFSNADTFCGTFYINREAWTKSKNSNLLKLSEDIIYFFAPSIKKMKNQCPETGEYFSFFVEP